MRLFFILVICLLFLPLMAAAGVDLLPEKNSLQPSTVASGSDGVAGSADDAKPSWGLIVLMLMLGGFLFMFLEIAIIPGFGITGIVGILLLLGGFATAYMKLSTGMALFTTIAGIIGVVLLMLWFFFVFPKTRLGRQFVLEADSSSADGYIAVEDNERYLGKEGVTTTILRPSGIARIDGERLDVITDGEFVEKGVAVKVVKTGAGRIIVAPVINQD